MACFSLGEDYSAFLSLEAADADLREARTSLGECSWGCSRYPRLFAQVSGHGALRGPPTVKDQVRLHSQPWMNLRLRPAWLETPTEVSPQEDVPALVRIPVKAKAPAHQPCHTIRFLLGPSGVAHSCVSPRLPHALPGV